MTTSAPPRRGRDGPGHGDQRARGGVVLGVEVQRVRTPEGVRVATGPGARRNDAARGVRVAQARVVVLAVLGVARQGRRRRSRRRTRGGRRGARRGRGGAGRRGSGAGRGRGRARGRAGLRWSWWGRRSSWSARRCRWSGRRPRRRRRRPRLRDVPPTAVALVRKAPETALPVAKDSATSTTPAPAMISPYSTADAPESRRARREDRPRPSMTSCSSRLTPRAHHPSGRGAEGRSKGHAGRPNGRWGPALA